MRSWTFDRIAIWNMAKIVTAISMAIWIVYVGINVSGKYLKQIMGSIVTW